MGQSFCFLNLEAVSAFPQAKSSSFLHFLSSDLSVVWLFSFSLFPAQFFHPCPASVMVSTGSGHSREKAQLSPRDKQMQCRDLSGLSLVQAKGELSRGVPFPASCFSGCFALRVSLWM